MLQHEAAPLSVQETPSDEQRLNALLANGTSGNTVHQGFLETDEELRRFLTGRFGSVQYVEDVLGQVWATATAKISQLENDASFVGWLKRIAYRTMLNHRRDARRNGYALLEGGIADQAETRQPDIVFSHTRAQALQLLELKMKPEDFQALKMFYLRQMRVDQIATELNAAAGTIKRRLHYARHRARNVLEHHGIFSVEDLA